ncbi:MAG TPA: cell division protein ZapA [Bryobacteraceae bacterium]|jgi:cell division protein ZapA|nr:cell division protein ZapA [Bryobacteraceae bacterium]
MDAARNAIRVTIFNQTYSLVVSSEAGEVESLARTVDELMSDISHRLGTADSNRVAVMACLHLADRLRAIERELADLKARVDEKSRQFSLLLDQASDSPE